MFSKKDKKNIIMRQPKIYSPPKEQKTIKIPKFVKILFFLIFLIGILFSVFIFSPLFKIKNIEIIGSLPENAQNYLAQFKGENIFLIKSDEIANVLKIQYPEFQSINVYKGIPNILRVRFEEREVKFIWITQNQNYFIDSDGLAFKVANPDAIGDLPKVVDNKNLKITIPGQVATNNFANFILNSELKIKDTGLKIKNFEVGDTIFQVDIVTNTGFKIVFDTTRSLSDQMDAFNQVYRDHKNEIKQYVDVRVEGKVYYQ